MSAIRRYMAGNDGRTPMKFIVDTSLDNGEKNYILPVAGATFQIRIDGGAPSLMENVTRPIIELPDHAETGTLHTIELLGRYAYTNNTGGGSHSGQFLDKLKLVRLLNFGNGNGISVNEFLGCNNLIIDTEDTPNLHGSIQGAFWSIGGIPSNALNFWDFSRVTSLWRGFTSIRTQFTTDINIVAPNLTAMSFCFENVGDFANTGSRWSSNLTIVAPNLTSAGRLLYTTRMEGVVKIIMQTPKLQSIDRAFQTGHSSMDLSEVDVRNVTNNESWISSSTPLDTDLADNMLVKWSQLPFMQPDVNWNLAGTQLTSIGIDAINQMETNFGNTFSNYSQL